MKNLIGAISLLLFVLLLAPNLTGQQQKFSEKYSKVKITIQDKTDIKDMQRAGLSLEGMKLEGQTLYLILNQREIMKLKGLGFPYEIMIDDMTKYYQERNSRTKAEMNNLEKQMKEKYRSGGFGFGSMGGYYTYDEIVAELDTMRMLYPNLITAKFSIGTTLEGRTIWAAKISDNPDINEDEPEVFYNSLTHAREPEGMMSVIYFMYYLLENYGSNPEITYLVDNRELYFVPCINADGYEYNHQMAPNGGYMWRKNKRDNNGDGVFEEAYDGVDLNRNYGYMWGFNDIGSSPDPGNEEYRGTEAFSEPEDKAIRDFCSAHNFLICNNYHTHWDVVFPPWGYNLTQTADSTIFNNLIRLGTQFNNYLLGIPWLPGNYESNGDVTDWMYGDVITKPRIFGVITEVGNDDDGFWPPPERIFPLAEENVYLNKVLAWGPGVIDDPPYIFEGGTDAAAYMNGGDSIMVTATESNPQAYSSVVTAYVTNSENITIDGIQLTETTINNYTGSCIVPGEENLYRVLLKDSCIDIPSNFFYYPENSRFTTAGPVTLDSVIFMEGTGDYYFVRPFVTNRGTEFTIPDAKIRLICHDSWAPDTNAVMDLPDLPPGESVGASGWFTQHFIDSLFPGYFDLKSEIMSDGYTYWQDSLRLVVVPVEVENGKQQHLTFALSQNYPNPFNPSTEIKYSVPHTSQVQIKIFDVLGNEIETLVNEEKPAGTYELTWNAANIPSGVYFYQLRATPSGAQAGGPSASSGQAFIQTKKMILLK